MGDFALCCLTVIPVRVNHNDTSEMVTQLLFGELVKILESHNQWLKVQLLHDNYTGWVDNKQLLPLKEEEAKILERKTHRQQEGELIVNTPWGPQKVLQGAPVISNNKLLNLGSLQFKWEQQPTSIHNKSIIDLANDYLNSPYLWGGRTKYGIDCSGLTQTIFHQKGYLLQRDASQQVLQGKKISFDEHQPGDLAFFTSESTGNITHVGIILKHAKIIHAHGRVRVDTLDTKGIFDSEKGVYSHQLYCINRYEV